MKKGVGWDRNCTQVWHTFGANLLVLVHFAISFWALSIFWESFGSTKWWIFKRCSWKFFVLPLWSFFNLLAHLRLFFRITWQIALWPSWLSSKWFQTQLCFKYLEDLGSFLSSSLTAITVGWDWEAERPEVKSGGGLFVFPVLLRFILVVVSIEIWPSERWNLMGQLRSPNKPRTTRVVLDVGSGVVSQSSSGLN